MYFTNLECDAGKFGPHCEKDCPCLFYGNLCAFKCYCNKDLCDPADGCSGKDTLLVFNYGLLNFLWYKYVFITLFASSCKSLWLV